MISTRTHFFTVDVEEYFQVSALEPYVRRSEWDTRTSRLDAPLIRILELLETHKAAATFFVLGWIAERHPDLVRSISGAGHDVASHGWGHRRVTTLDPAQFRESVRRSKELLEDLTGRPVRGYRAPSFSIVPGREWALEILVEEGFTYDSSLFPIRRPGYGYRNGKRSPHWLDVNGGKLLEVPPTTVKTWGATLPAAGGGYFRLLPYGVTRFALKRCEKEGIPGTFYIHPWELDPDQPRERTSLLTRFRHYGRLRSTTHKLERLLADFKFTSIQDGIADFD